MADNIGSEIPDTSVATQGSAPSARAVADSIDAIRQRLALVLAIVHTNANLLNETYHFDRAEADLGTCSDVVKEYIERAITGLTVLDIAPSAGAETSDRLLAVSHPLLLAASLEVQRQLLFRAQQVAQAIAIILKRHHFGPREADLGVVFTQVYDTLDQLLGDIEPMSLGLPTPRL